MLMDMRDLPAVAQENHFTIPAFNIGGDQLLKAIVKKVKESNPLAILEMSPDELDFIGGAQIQAMIYETAQTDVPACIHLDHGDSYGTVAHAIRTDVTSVMIDASALPYEENAAVAKKVMETAYIANVSVKSELGTISTTDNSIEGRTQGVIYTVPEEAKQFIRNTGIDTFAVTIGTAHGIYLEDTEPELRADILRDIISKVDVPLALYGGSSNRDKETAAAVDNGICKISISSDVRVALYTQCRKTLDENPDYHESPEIYLKAMEVCGKVVEEEIRLFKSNDRVKYYC